MNNIAFGKPIDVIVHTDKNGNLRPIRFRVENGQGERITVNVKGSIVKNIKRLGQVRIITFLCRSIINDMIRDYEIRYDNATMKWTLHADRDM